ncbi:hypothetical protein M0804_004551 [Polistes exclamans]|nr:hypothetical protein M0804_004551 [Polistes exclamans]
MFERGTVFPPTLSLPLPCLPAPAPAPAPAPSPSPAPADRVGGYVTASSNIQANVIAIGARARNRNLRCLLFLFLTLGKCVQARKPHSKTSRSVLKYQKQQQQQQQQQLGHLLVTAPTGNHVIESSSPRDFHFVDDRFLQTPTIFHLI